MSNEERHQFASSQREQTMLQHNEVSHLSNQWDMSMDENEKIKGEFVIHESNDGFPFFAYIFHIKKNLHAWLNKNGAIMVMETVNGHEFPIPKPHYGLSELDHDVFFGVNNHPTKTEDEKIFERDIRWESFRLHWLKYIVD